MSTRRQVILAIATLAAIPNSKIDKGAPIPQDQGDCL